MVNDDPILLVEPRLEGEIRDQRGFFLQLAFLPEIEMIRRERNFLAKQSHGEPLQQNAGNQTVEVALVSDDDFRFGQRHIFCGKVIQFRIYGERGIRFAKIFPLKSRRFFARMRVLFEMKRTHHCNELRPQHIGQTVTLSGWVHSRRDLAGLIFIDIRDREGRTQTVFDPSDLPKELFAQAAALRSECVISITGKVRQRPAGTNNAKIPTGEIEVGVTALEVLNMADVLPFPVDDPEIANKVNEELRLQYRYLDLRRPEMARNLKVRSKVAIATRQYMDEQGFLEVETPTLFKSTPEGAREFLVPNRREPGTFYALPQSPQQFKQILMVAGVEKYFQLARCYRDEDLRADRQPEFTQVDIEMSFIEREDIYNLIEGLLKRVWKTALNLDISTPFKRISFEEALNRFGIDKPDTRFGMELVDFTEEFKASTFKVFSGAIASGGVVKALNAKGLAGATQGQIETMTEYAKSFGAKGLAFIKVEGGEWKSPIVKFFNDTEKAALTSKLKIEEGDLILFAADQWLTACEILGKIRLYCAEVSKSQGKLSIPGDRFDFLWVVDFPLLSFDKEQNRWYSSHHPFTAPVAEDVPLLLR